jgi:putative spermidine/putrescine transport system substrate-binding protein
MRGRNVKAAKTRALSLTTGLISLSLLTAACGSSSSSGSTAATSAAAAATSAAAAATSGAATGSAAAATSAAGGSAVAATTTDASKATSAAALGGMDALVTAAKKEGTINVIALPANWANYGAILKGFTAKYGIKIVSANPDGSSQDELNAVKQLKGQSRAPDVLDVGSSFALTAASTKLLAPYKVATWASIPDSAKETTGLWYGDYGGYVAIGYDSAKIKTPPTSFKDLLGSEFKKSVALNGDPTQTGAAFAGVYAAALANGGSFDNIAPGVAYFKKLKDAGNYLTVKGTPATVQSGQTPVLIYWDYLQAGQIATQTKTWKIVIPTDGVYAAYYDQAVSATAPHPAAARLFEEYLYSVEGQNLWLQGKARPIELAAMTTAGTADKAALAALPPAPAGTVTFPTQAQLTKAQTVLTQQWSSAVG